MTLHPSCRKWKPNSGQAPTWKTSSARRRCSNYVEHRAIFEGFNAHLWAPNSGRLLWMTQPAWPSSSWQILSSDYDTQASFYGVKKACEPIHVQLDLVQLRSGCRQHYRSELPDASLSARVYSLENKLLLESSRSCRSAPTGLRRVSSWSLHLCSPPGWSSSNSP